MQYALPALALRRYDSVKQYERFALRLRMMRDWKVGGAGQQITNGLLEGCHCWIAVNVDCRGGSVLFLC